MRFKTLLRKALVPVLIGTVILSGLTGLAAARSTAVNQNSGENFAETQDQQTGYVGSINLGREDQDKDETKDAAGEDRESAALAPLAKITKDEAIDAAKSAYPGYSVEKVELENENGFLVYGVEISNRSGKSLDVKIDAGNAKVLSAQSDAEDGVE